MSITKEKELLQGKTVRVLLVEDEETDAKWVARSLEKFEGAEFRLHWSNCLKEALESLHEETYDVIISDLKLPDGFALEVFDALYKAASHTPIILLTGAVGEEDAATEALQKGAADYLMKDKITSEGLIRALVYTMERHKLLALKDQFVNVVSHELRTPLGILRETVAQVYEGLLGPVSESQKEFLKMALKAVDRLNRTCSELLNLARMEAGKDELNKESFDLTALADESMKQFSALVQKKTLELKCTFAKGLSLTVSADRDKIARVFINFLNNALKFTETGSIEIAVKDCGDEVECSVRDTGVGISAKDLPQVFDKFKQFGKKSKASQGSGLGLSICKEIIALHQGKIWVESEPGKGSQFVFTLPKA